MSEAMEPMGLLIKKINGEYDRAIEDLEDKKKIALLEEQRDRTIKEIVEGLDGMTLDDRIDAIWNMLDAPTLNLPGLAEMFYVK